jgi:ATP-dependent DNA helicase DinG
MSSRQLQDVVADISKESALVKVDVALISKAYYSVLDAVEKYYSSVAKKMKETRELWRDVISDKTVLSSFEKLTRDLLSLEDMLLAIANESPGLAQSYKRIGEINGLLDEFKAISRNAVQWIELGRRRFVIGSVPLNVATPYQRAIQEYQCAWIYTSATLTAKQSFNHFVDQLGLQEAECVMCDSPYDYAGQSRLYLPSLKSQPNEQGYTDEVIKTAIPLLEASRGNAFILFTSHKALNHAADILKNSQFNILVQGAAAKRELLKQFQQTDNCVLLGTQSFWEGVDVKGQNLRLVIIDKLPFVSPADPLVRARSKALEEAGENPFIYYQIPQAILNLKQGVGRLIRGEQDCGVVVLMDPRLKSKNYGKSFLKSLPPMTISEDERHVKQFLQVIHDSETASY